MNNKFHSFLGGDHPEGQYLRAIDLYKHDEEIQKKQYTYDALRQPGGIRGNGMLLRIDPKNLGVQTITSKILDYNSVLDEGIFKEIERLPKPARPLLYWFLISIPDRNIHQRAASEFAQQIKFSRELKLESFRAASPTLVSQRIDEAVCKSKSAKTN